MATVAELNTAVDAAVTLIAASSWAAAKVLLIKAKAILVGLPDAGQGDLSLRWDRDAIDSLIETVENEAAGAAYAAAGGFGIQQTKVRFPRPGAST